jgi:hypothetical protein
MNLWLEASLSELYKNTLSSFPNTTKRQFAIDTVKIENLQWVPFQGVKTLFVKAIVNNEGRANESIMLFKNVNYQLNQKKGTVPVVGANGKKVFIEQISSEQNDVLVRCSCKDFYWTFLHFNSLEKSLFGRDRKRYEAIYNPDSRNPEHSPGLCKHLIKLSKILQNSNLLI